MFNNCNQCGSKVETFYNPSYYDMFTVRCYTCNKEWNYATEEIALKEWNANASKT